MSKARNTGNLNNAIQVSNTGAITFVSGSTTLATINTSGQLSGSTPALSASYAVTATTAASSTSASYATNATTAVVATTASFADALTVAGTLTAQTLVVQTITSSVDFVTGSTRFGSVLGNTHVFTGSLNATGSSHSILGDIGIGVSTPSDNFHLQNNEGYLTLLYKSTASVEADTDTQIIKNYHTYDYLGNRHGYETSISTYGYLNTFYQPGANYFGRSGSSTYFMHFESGYNTASLQKTIFQLNGNTKLTLLESGEIVMGKEDYSALYQTSWFPATLRGPQPSQFSSDIAGGSLIIQGGRGRGTGAGGDILFKTSNAGNESSSTLNAAQTRMVIKGSDGNVGIGTTSPSSPLHILRYAGSSGTVLLEGNDNVVGLPGVTFKNNNGGATSYVSMTAGGGVNINGILYATGSNVGIGTSTPAAKLDVNGTGNYSSTLIVNSSGGYSNGGSALNIESNSWAIVDANVKRQMQRVIGYVGDYEQHVILLHPIYNGTLIEFSKCTGTIFATRGWTYAGRISDTYEVDTSTGYADFSGALKSNVGLGRLYTCLYNGVKYMALIPQYRTSAVVYHFDGYIANNTGGETLKTVTYRNSSTGTIVNSEIYNSLTPYTENDNFINGLLYPRQGIRFASGASTLNYYEEGTFTPTNIGSNFNSVTPVWGRYVRVGNQVTVSCRWLVDAPVGKRYLVFNLPFSFYDNSNISYTGAVSNYNAGLSSYSSNVGTSVRNSSGSTTQQYVEAVYTSNDGANTLLFSMTYFTF